ncbi:hypothetical protein ECC02_012998 [Trypanosoma cruzi]|uniref:Uncharacterized protein n=1 Tax=Trypanosoma cruzi TaxID=5693 RepID=A0A7J6XJI4_TRYCR|nr:hypothetical protein ECC02_012998 [Trypanosoma cruzi]
MKQHNASKGAECRHPVRQRHGAILAMYEAKATKQLSSAIVIASSRFALLFLGASSLSKTPAAAAVDHAAAAITPTERQRRVCVSVCREHSDCHRQRRPSWHRPSRASTHRATHSTGSANTFLQSTVQILMCVGVCWRSRRGAQGGTSEQQEAQLDGSDTCGAAPTSTITHGGSTHKSKNKKNTAAGCGCMCGAAGVCPPWPQRKQNKRERNVCSAPQALVARPHVTAPSARRSSRPLLMRAAGEAHRAVVMSVSVGVRVEQLGGKHTAPLTGRVQKKQLKERRVEKKKTSILIVPKEQKSEEMGE